MLAENRFGAFAGLLEAFGEVLTEPFFILDEAERVVGCNPAALRAADTASFEALLAKAGGKLSPLFVKEKGLFTPDREAWMAPLGEGNPTVALRNKDGRKHPYRLRVQPVLLEGEKFFLAHLDDIDMVHRARRAQHYFETFKQQFLTNISHEFRTPMNSIIGFAGLLEQDETDAQKREYIAHIQHSAGTMLENVENLLELMQMENGRAEIRRDAFNVYGEFETFLQGFCKTAEEKRINLFFMLDPHLPALMIGDAEKIKKILGNLVSNAIKFTPEEGQILVEIKVRELGRRTSVRYSVTDTGEGIAKDKLQTLLRPFTATQENDLRGKEGFGIGLTLAFRLLKLLGSEPAVSSEVGRGSRFAFTLTHPRLEPAPFRLMQGSRIALWHEDPADVIQQKILKKYLSLFNIQAVEADILQDGTLRGIDALFMISRTLNRANTEALRARYPDLQIVPVIHAANEPAFREAETLFEAIVTLPILPTKVHDALSVIWKHVPKALLRPEKPAAETKKREARRILVVEDNLINQKLITTILEQHGYRFTTANNGEEGVAAYAAGSFDTVLMDIDMPVLDGISATQRIRELAEREKRPFTPVIALTARAMAGERERILGAGLDAHLAKPVDREVLLATIERYLKMKDERNRKMR